MYVYVFLSCVWCLIQKAMYHKFTLGIQLYEPHNDCDATNMLEFLFVIVPTKCITSQIPNFSE